QVRQQDRLGITRTRYPRGGGGAQIVGLKRVGQKAYPAARDESRGEILVGEAGQNGKVMLPAAGLGVVDRVLTQVAGNLLGAAAGSSVVIEDSPGVILILPAIPVLDPAGNLAGQLLDGVVDQGRVGQVDVGFYFKMLFVDVVQRVGEIHGH